MEASTLFYAVLAALGYIALQSFFMIGVWISAHGDTEKKPDGKDYDSEMILFPIKKFLTQSSKEKVFYEGKYLQQLVERIKVQLPEFDFSFSEKEILMTREHPNYVQFVHLLNERTPRIDPNLQVELRDTGLRFYKMYVQYRFNKYLRKPIMQCPVCMSSVWSIFSYWIPVIYVFGLNATVIYLGVANSFILAAVNWWIATSRPPVPHKA